MNNDLATSLKGYLPRRGTFLANFLTLLSGTTLSHAILIGASPLLTRLYGPADFGLLALFMSLTNLSTGLVSCRYELAIMLPADNKEAANILGLCLMLSSAMCGLLFLVIAFFGQTIAQFLKSPELLPWLWWAPLSIFLGGLFNALTYWSTRNKRFHSVAVARAGLSVGTVGTQLGSGMAPFAGAGGLIGGLVAGQAVGAGILAKQIWSGDGKLISASLSQSGMWEQAKRHRKFPLLALWASLSNNLARQLPVWFIAIGFGALDTGYFSLAFRTITLPAAFIGESIGQVFFQRASEHKNQIGSSYDLTKKVALALLVIPALPFIVLMLWGPEIFAFVFGEQWATAGRYAAILCPLTWAAFIMSPLSMLNAVHETQEIGLIWQLGLVSITFGVFYFTTKLQLPIEQVLHYYAMILLVWYLVNVAILIRISKGGPLFYQRRREH